MKIKFVINTCFGGFSISKKAAEWMIERGHKEIEKELESQKKSGRDLSELGDLGYGRYLDRADPLLVEAVESLGEEANGPSADLSVEEHEIKVKDFINEYDGKETLSIRI